MQAFIIIIIVIKKCIRVKLAFVLATDYTARWVINWAMYLVSDRSLQHRSHWGELLEVKQDCSGVEDLKKKWKKKKSFQQAQLETKAWWKCFADDYSGNIKFRIFT